MEKVVYLALAALLGATALNVAFLAGAGSADAAGTVKCGWCLAELGYPHCRSGWRCADGAHSRWGRCIDCGCVPGYQALRPVLWQPN
jgi:hypothetical protein